MIKLQVEASFDDLAKFASENPRIKNSQIEPCSCGRTCLGNLHHAPSPPAVAVPRLQSSDAALHGQMLLFHLADQRRLTL